MADTDSAPSTLPIPPAPADALAAAIAQLHTHRAALGDAAVDAAIDALRRHARPAGHDAPVRLRQVSILFADVADSTAMLGRVAPDEAMELLGQALQGFADAVQRWGGQVLRYTGDGIKAAFGMQGLREDEAERAVRAGLEMLETAARHAAQVQRSLGIEGFGVRVGIHTGAVLLGGGVEAERTAMGHAVHLAARMEQSAPVGRLRVSEATWALVRGLFVAEAQPPLQVKGHAEPLRTWLVSGSVAGPEPVVQRGLDDVRPPLVGREAELGALLQLHARMRAERRPVLAWVQAEAGVGKTRLRHELLQALGLAEGEPGLLQARATPSTPLQPFGLLHHLLARWLHIHDDAPAHVARQALIDGLAPWLGDETGIAAPRIGQLLGLDFGSHPAVQALPGAALRDEAGRALRRALRAVATAHPLLLVLDDVHWADAESLQLLAPLLDPAEQPAVPLMVLALARPSVHERGLALPTAEPVPRLELALAPLADGADRRLLQALLAPLAAPAPEPLQALLLQRSAGNPFFLEALVRMLVDDGVIDTRVRPWQLDTARLDTLRVPPTLVGVLQARLDTLPAHELRALQWASVVGPVFWDAAVGAIDGPALQTLPQLAQRALVHERSGSAFAGTDERAFAHALLHEVTYGTVLKAERRGAHEAVAQWLAQRVGDRGVEFLAVTAEHFERAGQGERALHYWDLACHEASQRYANDAALQLVERVLAQPALTDARWRHAALGLRHDLLERMGRVAEAEQALAAVQAHAHACQDRAILADVLATRMLTADRAGHSDEAARLADEALAQADPADPGSAAARALAHGERCWLAIVRADWPVVTRELAAARAAAAEAALVPRRGMGSSAYGMQLQVMEFEALARQGLAQATVDAARAALPASEQRPRDRFNVLVRLVGSLAELGRHAEALQQAEAALALATAAGLPRQRAVARSHLGHALRLHDRLDEALAVLDAGLAEARGTDTAPIQPSLLSHIADVLQAQGQLAPALERALEAVALCDAQDNPLQAAACRCQAAQLALACGAPAQARTLLDAALQATCDDAAAEPSRVRHARLEPTPMGHAWQVAQALGDPRAAGLHAELHERLARTLPQLPDAQARRWLLDAEPWVLLPDRPAA